MFQCTANNAALRVWNALPSHVISVDSLDSFKARLKSHLFDIV